MLGGGGRGRVHNDSGRYVLTDDAAFGDREVMGVVLEGEHEVELHYLTSVMTTSKFFGKFAFATWLRQPKRIRGGVVRILLIILVHALEWSSGRLNSYVFLLVILLIRKREVSFSSIVLGVSLKKDLSKSWEM